MSDGPVYLDAKGVAERIGVDVATVYVYVARGTIPEPDYQWRRHKFWLEETIDEWRRYKHKKNIPPRIRPRKRPTTELPSPPLNINPPPKPKRRQPRTREVRVPESTVVSRDVAGRIAQSLRAEGNYCTVEDVIVLANHDGDGLERERKLLRDRVLAKLRGFAARV